MWSAAPDPKWSLLPGSLEAMQTTSRGWNTLSQSQGPVYRAQCQRPGLNAADRPGIVLCGSGTFSHLYASAGRHHFRTGNCRAKRFSECLPHPAGKRRAGFPAEAHAGCVSQPIHPRASGSAPLALLSALPKGLGDSRSS